MRQIAILGSTGSIGTQALDVARRHPDRFKVVALTAGSSHELLVGQVREFMPQVVAVAEEEAARELTAKLGGLRAVEVLSGPQAAEFVAREIDADMVLNAMVGAVGLRPTLAALQSGKMLALANKESLIIGGELVTDLVKGEPERLVPVDSEHAALAQCLRGERRDDLRRVIITGSGGPFRGWSRDELALASVKEALAHPTWSMGPKITIDSATLMNKGLEIIEAHYLFGLGYAEIDVVIHPESVVHGIAEFILGFGPRLWSTRRGETEYGVKALPFGGYVRIAGMNPFQEPTQEELPRTFGAKPAWQRALVIVAGPATHFFIAFLVLVGLLAFVGQPRFEPVVSG